MVNEKVETNTVLRSVVVMQSVRRRRRSEEVIVRKEVVAISGPGNQRDTDRPLTPGMSMDVHIRVGHETEIPSPCQCYPGFELIKTGTASLLHISHL